MEDITVIPIGVLCFAGHLYITKHLLTKIDKETKENRRFVWTFNHFTQLFTLQVQEASIIPIIKYKRKDNVRVHI